MLMLFAVLKSLIPFCLNTACTSLSCNVAFLSSIKDYCSVICVKESSLNFCLFDLS